MERRLRPWPKRLSFRRLSSQTIGLVRQDHLPGEYKGGISSDSECCDARAMAAMGHKLLPTFATATEELASIAAANDANRQHAARYRRC